MRNDGSSISSDSYNWYKFESIIIGVREKKMGGYSIKIHDNYFELNMKSLKSLLNKILDYYK